MVHSARAKTWSAIGFTLALLCGTSGGCMRAPCSGIAGCGPCCLFPLHGCAHRQAPVYVVDPVCYGYHTTAWCPWPDQCGGCPTDPLHPLAAPNGTTGEGEEGTVEGPDAAAHGETSGPGGKAGDLEALPLRDSNAIDAPAPPPETEGEKPPQKAAPLPEPPAKDGATTKAGEPMLRFVSYFRSVVVPPGGPEDGSEEVQGQSTEPKRWQPPTGNLGRDTISAEAGGSLPSDEQEDWVILEALRRCFSRPARPQPPAEDPSSPSGD